MLNKPVAVLTVSLPSPSSLLKLPIEAVMAAQSSFEFTGVVGGGGGGDVIFNITEGGLELIFFVLEGGYCLSFAR